MQTRIDRKRAAYQFDSAYEMETYIANAPRTWSYKSAESASHTGKSWDLSVGYAGACDLMRGGWIEGAQRVQKTLAAMPPMTPAPVTRTDFYGHLPHVARFCAGAPDSMIRYDRDARNGSRPVLTLYCAINANCMERADAMANYGVAMAQYINQMETDGTRIELYAVFANEFQGGRRGSWCWRVKSADQPLDLAVLAFSVGHPAAFRRIGFAVMERSDIRAQSNYGYSDDATLRDLIDPPAGAIILNGMLNANTHAATVPKALAHIEQQITDAITKREKE